MSSTQIIRTDKVSGQSTLLISRKLQKENPFIQTLRGKSLSEYLHRLLNDPDLHKKIGFLKSGKVKKIYQRTGMDLEKVYFYPSDEDWAILSAISNGTGFSRCFVFVFLMKLDLGLLKLPCCNRIQKNFSLNSNINWIYCEIFIDKREKLLIRKLQP